MIEINLLPVEHRRKAAPKFTMPEIPIKKTMMTVAGAASAAKTRDGRLGSANVSKVTQRVRLAARQSEKRGGTPIIQGDSNPAPHSAKRRGANHGSDHGLQKV